MRLRLFVAHGDGSRAELEVEGPSSIRPSMRSPGDLLEALYEMEQIVNASGRLRLHVELQDSDPLSGFAKDKE